MKPIVRLAIAALGAASVLAAGAARADEPAGRQPYDAIRTLKRLQEQVAHGSKAAHKSQVALLASMGSEFVDADPMVWRDPRNARAAVLYLFSGGKPVVVRTVLSRSTMPRDSDRLLKGALAYAEGQDQTARDLLAPIDPKSLTPAVGGPLALVQATLFAASDAKKAGRYLDLARLLVPGSLVEEAALRRQINLETDTAALPKFVTLSRQYLHRFSDSIYAQNFKQHFAAVALRLGGQGDVALIARLDPVIDELRPEEQRAVYLGMAKAAVVTGHTEAARYAATHAASLASASTADAARAKLYLDATAITSEDMTKAIAALEAADKTRLSPEDADLRDAALAVARSVEAPVPDPKTETASASPAAEGDTGALTEQARKMLRDGDQLLDEAK